MSDTRPAGQATPLTEEQIRKVTAYEPAWPDDFVQESTRIRAALGERALGIEHVGSTTVPRLVAKPIIDILLVVADSAVQNYADAKSAVVEEIIARAREGLARDAACS